MAHQEDSENATTEYLKTKLKISAEGRILREFPGPVPPVPPDLVIVDGTKGYLVEIERRVSLDVLSKLNLLKDLIRPEDMGVSDLSYYLAGNTISHSVRSLAASLGIRVLLLPGAAGVTEPSERKYGTVRVTTEKAWRVASLLIKERTSSIRSLALKEKVSYGWAHATVQGLKRQGIVRQTVNRVIVEDVDKLLNGAAWERPFQTFVRKELRTPFKGTYEGAKETTAALEDRGLKFAFAGYIAGTLYTGQSVRHDLIQIYMDS
ncbi:MAG: hypothetical protein FJY85_12520, partial [Deltaproteobacteria bacterium]|nr:hypothetical protein [Deltaproteobacteria bacterium]